MTRRALFVLIALCLAVVATAVVPWTVTSARLTATVADRLREAHGLQMTVGGRSTIALLPSPRLKFDDVALATLEGQALIRGGQLRGEISLPSLLAGRIELAEVALNGTRIELAGDAAGLGWAELTSAKLWTALRDRRGRSPLRRLILTGASVRVLGGSDAVLRDVNLVANWANPDAPLELAGNLRWRGELLRVSLTDARPAVLARGGSSPASLHVEGPALRFTLVGDLRGGEAARFTGHALVESTSPRELARWSGASIPLAALTPAFTAEGPVVIEAGGLSASSARVTLGADRLDGAVSVKLDGARPVVTGTFAGDALDLTSYVAPLREARGSDGGWSAEPFDLARLTAGDLDIRLSASAAKLGALRVEDVAASVIVRPERVEVSLGRASLHSGVLKGRLAVSGGREGAELRLQAGMERVDFNPLLADLGHSRWLAGSAQGQVALEGWGASPAELMQRVHGRGSLVLRQGELIGIALGDALKRIGRHPLAGSLDWRGGRTPFEQAHVNLLVTNGVGEITDGGLVAATVRGALQGRVSLMDRTITARASVETVPIAPQPGPPALAFEVSGPWESVGVAPDVRALIQRSGAAQPLLPPEVRLRLERELAQPTASAGQ